MSVTTVFRLFFVLCLTDSGTVAQVTLRLLNERTCSEDNLTFSCETAKSGLLAWTIVSLPGVTGIINSFGEDLNSALNAVRITSTDSSSGPNPSSITIHNATAADNGATVQCRIVNMERSNVYTLSIRPPECLLTMDATVNSDTSITVKLMWSNCEDTEPSSLSLRLSPAAAQDPIVVNGLAKVIDGLMANTTYNIIASFTDACGNISAMAEVTTLPDMPGVNGGNDNITEGTSPPPTPPPIGVIVGSVAAGLIVLALVVIITVVAVLIFQHMKKSQTHGEKLTARHGEEMVDMREDTTYAAPGKDKTAAESGDAGGVYSYAATTTVVGAKHTKPGAKPSGERNVAENISAHPEKPMRGSKKQPPPANVPHKQGPVGDLYAMPDKKALEVGHKSGPQGDMYAMSVKPSKGGYGAEGPN